MEKELPGKDPDEYIDERAKFLRERNKNGNAP